MNSGQVQHNEGGIAIVSGIEILCQRDLSLGPIVAREFRFTVEDGHAVLDAVSLFGMRRHGYRSAD